MVTDRAVRLLTVSEYHQMGAYQIIRPDERVELIEGKILHMSPIGSKHAYVVDNFNLILIEQIGRKAVVRVQNPITLGEHSEPEPDLVIAKLPRSAYLTHHPGPNDILLVIEVADACLSLDREVKLPLYASFSIPQVWLVDLKSQTLEMYAQPDGRTYTDQKLLKSRKGETAMFLEPEVRISVDELFA